MKFRKKPVIIDAVLWDGSAEALAALSVIGLHRDDFYLNRPFEITTLEGDMLCSLGDWVIKGVKGEFYPCKPDIFEMTYEPAEPEASRILEGKE